MPEDHGIVLHLHPPQQTRLCPPLDGLGTQRPAALSHLAMHLIAHNTASYDRGLLALLACDAVLCSPALARVIRRLLTKPNAILCTARSHHPYYTSGGVPRYFMPISTPLHCHWSPTLQLFEFAPNPENTDVASTFVHDHRRPLGLQNVVLPAQCISTTVRTDRRFSGPHETCQSTTPSQRQDCMHNALSKSL